MKFRDIQIDEIIVIENCDSITLERKLCEMADTYVLVDLQYSTTKSLTKGTLHNALALVRYKRSSEIST